MQILSQLCYKARGHRRTNHISLGQCKAEHWAVRYKLKSCTVPIFVPFPLSNIPALLYRPDVCNCTMPYAPHTVPVYVVPCLDSRSGRSVVRAMLKLFSKFTSLKFFSLNKTNTLFTLRKTQWGEKIKRKNQDNITKGRGNYSSYHQTYLVLITKLIKKRNNLYTLDFL